MTADRLKIHRYVSMCVYIFLHQKVITASIYHVIASSTFPMHENNATVCRVRGKNNTGHDLFYRDLIRAMNADKVTPPLRLYSLSNTHIHTKLMILVTSHTAEQRNSTFPHHENLRTIPIVQR